MKVSDLFEAKESILSLIKKNLNRTVRIEVSSDPIIYNASINTYYDPDYGTPVRLSTTHSNSSSFEGAFTKIKGTRVSFVFESPSRVIALWKYDGYDEPGELRSCDFNIKNIKLVQPIYHGKTPAGAASYIAGRYHAKGHERGDLNRARVRSHDAAADGVEIHHKLLTDKIFSNKKKLLAVLASCYKDQDYYKSIDIIKDSIEHGYNYPEFKDVLLKVVLGQYKRNVDLGSYYETKALIREIKQSGFKYPEFQAIEKSMKAGKRK